jgi:hypothetical protein
MNTPVVTGAPEGQQPPVQQQPQPNAELDALKRQVEDFKNQAEEFKNTAQYWHDEAKRKPAAAAVATATPAADDDTDLLEVLTTKGTKGLLEVIKKHGFVSKDEAQSMVNTKADSIAREQELLGDYPDLKNRNSEFFKDTAKAYGTLVNSGVPANMAMELAAKQTHLEHIQTGKLKSKPMQTADDAAAKEQRRVARIAAQSGDRGAAPTPEDAEENDELSPGEKRICAEMGVSEDAYKKRRSTTNIFSRSRR